MTKPSAPYSRFSEVENLLARHPNIPVREASRKLRLTYSITHKYMNLVRAGAQLSESGRNVEIAHLPDEDLDVKDILERRRATFARMDKANKARRSIPVRVKMTGPIGVTVFGDPHLDDNGTDITAVERDIRLVKGTQGMFAGNIGDTSNNWVGRLKHLHGSQSTTEREAWKLVEWFVQELPWLFFLDGNHGAWSGAGNPVDWMLSNANSIHDDMEARMELAFPNGMKSTIFARHDFPGHSQWNESHGLNKAASLGGYDDSLLLAGHKHTGAYNILKNPKTGVLSHCVRVAGYKVWDKYAKDHFLYDRRISESAAIIFNPEVAPTDPRHIQVFFSVEEGCDFLKFKRSKTKGL
jgi:hypothetical protein